MPKFSFTKLVDIDRDVFFAISTDYEKFTNLFWLGRIFPWTLKYKESIGESLMSVASLCLEILTGEGRLMRDQILWKSWKSWDSQFLRLSSEI